MRRRKAAPPRRRGRLGRVVRRLLLAAALAIFLSAIFSAAFIGLKCYSGDSRLNPMRADTERVSAGIEQYTRDEASTFLTLPEWYIVYNTDEYARFIGAQNPSRFEYAGSIRQYWRYYGAMCNATRGVYPFSGGNHLMLGVIGSSFTIEYALKGLYENVVGRLTEWISGRDTPEDAFAQTTAQEYGTFMHTVPWYQFPFFSRVARLWRETPLVGPRILRKWERKFLLTAEYGVKGVYGALIGMGTGAAYAPEDLRIHAWIENAADAVFADHVVRKVKEVGPGSWIVTIPRYEAFTERTKLLANQGVRFMDIAGNDEILVTILTPAVLEKDDRLSVLLDEPLLTEGPVRRVALKVPVRSLHEIILRAEKSGARIEHVYDY